MRQSFESSEKERESESQAQGRFEKQFGVFVEKLFGRIQSLESSMLERDRQLKKRMLEVERRLTNALRTNRTNDRLNDVPVSREENMATPSPNDPPSKPLLSVSTPSHPNGSPQVSVQIPNRVECSSCLKHLPSTIFSANQLRKKNPRCPSCIHSVRGLNGPRSDCSSTRGDFESVRWRDREDYRACDVEVRVRRFGTECIRWINDCRLKRAKGFELEAFREYCLWVKTLPEKERQPFTCKKCSNTVVKARYCSGYVLRAFPLRLLSTV